MLDFNVTLVAIIASFVVFMLAMKAVFFDPIRRIKVLREQKIKLDMISTQELQQELDTLSQRVQHQIKESRVKAQQLILDAKTTARSDATNTVQAARTEADLAYTSLQQQVAQKSDDLLSAMAHQKPQLVNLLLDRLAQTATLVKGAV
jgi:F0F1-type ATP synthase membrane subunit b/b'